MDDPASMCPTLPSASHSGPVLKQGQLKQWNRRWLSLRDGTVEWGEILAPADAASGQGRTGEKFMMSLKRRAAARKQQQHQQQLVGDDDEARQRKEKQHSFCSINTHRTTTTRACPST
jgi:hypothetical protein